MKVTILTFGTRGDVQPFVALGMGLCRAGYDVRLATYARFQSLADSAGIPFFPITGDIHAILFGKPGRKALDGGGPVAIARAGVKHMRPMLPELVAQCMAACQGSDVLLLGGAGNVAGTTIAEKMDIPFVAAFLQPLSTPTREYAAAFFPRLPIEVGPVNRLSYRLAVQGFWQFFRRAINEARESYFDMPPLPFLGPFGRYASEKRPILYGYSRHLVPRPADWPDHAWVTGNWFLERSRGWKPDRDLLAFMEAGPPPVYIGFGSMNSRDPQRTTRLVHDALAETGQRGILLSGWGGMISESRPKHIFVAEDIPHDWLFPRVSAVVHHGGAGTTAAGLRAGAPTVTIPFFGDQPFWGWRVYKLGAGPKPLPQKRLTKEKLVCAIDRAVNEASMRANALALREKLVAEDGVGNAVARFQALFPG